MEVSSLYLQHVVILLVYFSILHVHFSFSLAQRSAKNGLFLLMIRLIHLSIYFYRKKLFHIFTTIAVISLICWVFCILHGVRKYFVK